MSPAEVKICLEFLEGGFCDYGTPGIVMFQEDMVNEFKRFVNLKLDQVKILRKFLEDDERALDGF